MAASFCGGKKEKETLKDSKSLGARSWAESFYLLHLQFSLVTQLCPTLWDPMNSSPPGFPVHHQLPELAQTHVRRVSDAIQPSHPLLSLFPPAFNLFQHQSFFSNKSVLRIRWSKYWSFSFSISPSNESSRLISFRMDCFDLFSVQGTLKSPLQHHSSKASILRCSALFINFFSARLSFSFLYCILLST